MILLVLGWILIGMLTMTWLIRRSGDDTAWLIVVAVFVYFAVPLLVAPMLAP